MQTNTNSELRRARRRYRLSVIAIFILMIILVLLSVFASGQTRKGFYFNTAAGASIGLGNPLATVSLNAGYSFGRSKLSFYNQAGAGYVKFLSLEYNFQANLGKKGAVYTITGVTPLNMVLRTSGIARGIESDSRISYEVGAGLKRYFSPKIAATFAVRASIFKVADYGTEANKYISPLTFTLGIGK